MNTAFAAKTIAQWAGVAESAIGYAGLKDRHAVTRQRFSVWIPKKVAPDIALLQSDDLRVLEPVSYTHLDVYKRQGRRRSVLARLGKPARQAGGDTVSYTHLDVYKRQAKT